jgi:hypothetical protein
MGDYRFIGDNAYFNPFCTSSLVFDKKDSSTNRILCMEETCIDHYYEPTVVPTACRVSMLPSGYTTDRFEWGIEGSPWTLNVDYGKHYPESGFTHEFLGAKSTVGGGEAFEAGGNFMIRTTNSNGSYNYHVNQNAFNNKFNLAKLKSDGYRAMSSRDLNGRSIDLGTLMGAREYSPTRVSWNNSLRCGVSAGINPPPEISYFDVGSSELPDTHTVTFPDYLIDNQYMSYVNDGSSGNLAIYESYIKYALPPNAAIGIKQGYASGIHPPLPSGIEAQITSDLMSFIPKWNPAFDSNNSTNVVNGSEFTRNFITGYRMQKYVKETHNVYFTDAGAKVESFFTHEEHPVRMLGYTPELSIVSITPENYFIKSATGNISYLGGIKASVVISVTYKPYPFNANSYASYEYGTTIDPGDLVSKGAPCERSWVAPNWSPPYATYYQTVRKKCNELPGTIPAAAHTMNSIGTFVCYSAGAHSVDLNNPQNPRSRKRIAYYTFPLTKSSGGLGLKAKSYYSPVVDLTYKSYDPKYFANYITIPGPFVNAGGGMDSSSPSTIKLWRRKL